AAGGTGGHIMPALAVGDALRRYHPGVEVVYLCGQRDLEQSLYANHGESPIVMPARTLSGGIFGMTRGVAAACGNILRARRLALERRVRVVLGMGGYVSGPAVLGGRLAGCRTAIHEANAVAGRANRWLAPLVDLCALHFAETLPRLNAREVLRCGMPIREGLGVADRSDAAHHFGLDPLRPVLLIIGGSQGARPLYDRLMAALPMLDCAEHSGTQVLWAAGQANSESLAARLDAQPLRHLKITVVPFISRMDLALAIADGAIARAGASTLAELVSCGIPTLFVPYPHAVHDHQTRNAICAANCGAGDWIAEADLTPQAVREKVVGLLARLAPGKRQPVPPELDSRCAARDLAAALVRLATR
ncbi:MAG: UDP-N-acetylglucosamine--N-acetylmuramyl-(pentapeptide) pyrophosphoryl-undecaprenol N-acetylglucosamine transferase, partial [Candidatus Sumerlaeaceae bacterium]|nr:UDP-N-acetylglucosamine--N-acetylmuramyl-(pentapeptide) pyrophosphoryl-undecaprenol N-acetylglucosamine transferase [Candidatus Sumerlaeaceae bacterium]